MKFRIRFATQIVGLFTILAVVFVIVLMVAIGTGQGWFEPRYEYSTVLSSASGLNIGMTVDFRGFEVGRVTNISLSEDNNVNVTFNIRERYIHLVTKGSLVELATNPILGGTLVLHRGTRSDEPLEEFSVIPEWNSETGRAIRAVGIVERSQPPDPISTILSEIDPLLLSVSEILDSTQDILGTLSGTLDGSITDGPIADMVGQTLSLLAVLEDRLDDTEALLAGSEELLASVNRIADNAATASDEFRDPTGIVPQLLGGSGTVATLFDDDNMLFDEILGIFSSINETLDEVSQIARFAGAQTPQLAAILEEGREALIVGQDVLTGLRNNPLLRGGIPERIDQPSNVESFREAQF